MMTEATAFARPDRVFVRVFGRDPFRMVQGLITNDLNLANERRAVYAGLLTPKGRLLADLRVLRPGDEILLETATSALDNVLAHFRKFVPPLFARFEVAEQYSITGLYGAGSAQLLASAFGMVPPAVEDELSVQEDVTAIRTPYAGVEGFDLLTTGDTSALRASLQSAGAHEGDARLLECLRIEAGTPIWGAELDENVIPLEAGLRERMISESKGCYTGQEVIIRILHRGHVNSHLRGLLLGQVDPPVRGTPLLSPNDHKQVGRITSACVSPRMGQAIALGYARRELTLPARLHFEHADGPLVTVVELPFAGAGDAGRVVG